jgi:predicted nucleic acid-binding protein
VRVVCNAGPLIALAKLNALDLLLASYESVLVPSAVYAEVVERGVAQCRSDAFAVRDLVRHGLLAIADVAGGSIGGELATAPIDTGEKQVVYVAMREGIGTVLLDDQRAREQARAYSLEVRGTLGIIVAAVRVEAISTQRARGLVETILERSDIWIADELCRRVLAALRPC